MTLVSSEVLTPEVVSNDYLDGLASVIRVEHQRSKDALGDATDAYFAIGHALTEARKVLLSDQEFGTWYRAQKFGFSRQWAHTLRSAAELEPTVRAAVASQLATGGPPNIEKAVQHARTALGSGKHKPPKELTAVEQRAADILEGEKRAARAIERLTDLWPYFWSFHNGKRRARIEGHLTEPTLEAIAAIEEHIA